MGRMICEIHGITGITLVTSDISKDFLSNDQGPSEEYHQIKVNPFDDHIVTYCWISSDVADQLGIPVNKILSLDEFDSYRELPLEPVCGECFLEWINKK